MGPLMRYRSLAQWCGFVAGAGAVFWLVQMVRGATHGRLHVLHGLAVVIYFGLMAVAFLIVPKRKTIYAPSFWPFPPLALWLIEESPPHHWLRAAAIATVIGATGRLCWQRSSSGTGGARPNPSFE
jgi:hypothetical protein